MNYFLPIHGGSPDYNKVIQQFHSNTFKSNYNNHSNLGSYLAGLWESDGHVWLPKTVYSPSGHKYKPHFSVTFHEADYPLVLKLQSLLGGNIRFKKDNHAYVLTFYTISGLINIIGLINGNLRGPKINHFNCLIDWINNNTGFTLISKSPDNSDLLKNAWLSGFIDGDGSFDILVSLVNKGSKKNRVAARFRLEQQKIDTKSQLSYLNLLSLISNSLLIQLRTSIHNVDKEYFLISLSSQKSRDNLVEYLDKYPLFSSKLLNYIDWRECHCLIKRNEHLTEKGKNTALSLKSKMNTKRIYYNWDHLSKLENY